MTSIYALVKNGITQNVIVADQAFIDSHPEMYDVAVAFAMDGNSHPSPGDAYVDGVFVRQQEEILPE